MKKFIVITLVVLGVIFGGVIYLNQVFLPTKIKSLVVGAIEKQTNKKVSLKSLEFNIFKGLVLRDLVIADNNQVIISARRVNCAVFFLPIFKKQIIIPSIDLQSPYLFLERRKDNSFNLQDFLVPAKPAAASAKKADFNLAVYQVNLTGGKIVFQDDTLPEKFKKELSNVQFNLHLGLPVSVKFNFSAELSSSPASPINVWGEYRLLSKELFANLKIKNLAPQEFKAYYDPAGLFTVLGSADIQAQAVFKDPLLAVDITVVSNKLLLQKDNIKINSNLVFQSKVNYNLQAKKLGFNGNCDIQQASISGVEFLGEIKSLSGKCVFNERSLVADSLKVELLGIPLEINLGVKDFKTPVFNIATNLNLSFLPNIAKEKLNFALLSSAAGTAALTVKIHPGKKGVWTVDGSAQVTGASLKLDKPERSIEKIFAALEFSQEGLNWDNTKFTYQGIDYTTSGSLSNFTAPSIALKLFAQDLSLNAALELDKTKIKVEQVKGKYLNSTFLVNGDIDRAASGKALVDLNGEVNLALEDLNKVLNKQYPAIAGAKPAGNLNTRFNLIGDVTDFKNCSIQAKLTSNNFSLFGLKSQDLALDYQQEQQIAKIPVLRIAFYDGLINAFGSMNLGIASLPYHFEMNAGEIKLEKLKLDTSSKNKSYSGTLAGELKLNGFSNDLAKLSGAGNFSIKDGKLWELDLLRGVGKLLFVKDLANIEFSECACTFQIKDKFISTDDLRLKSRITNLAGNLKIGFDNSLEGALDVEILSDLIPLNGSLKDLTTEIMGQAGKFGVIKLSGTLQKPKYGFTPAVGNIIKGLTDIFLKKQA